MNTSQYKKQYLNNLKLEISNNNKHLSANKNQPSISQYIQNTNQQVLGVSTFNYGGITQIQPKGTKFNGFK
jgi:hypothetical protein